MLAGSCWPERRRALAIWVGNSNGTSGRVGVQNSSLSKLLGWNWNLEKSIAIGTHNSEALDHLERRLAARGDEARKPMRIGERRAGGERGSAERPEPDHDLRAEK